MSDPIAKRRPEESAVGREAAEMTARLYRITNTAPARLCSLALGVCLFAFIILPASAAAIPSEHPFEIIPGSFHITPSTYQAGAHANLDTTFDFAHNAEGQTYNEVRTTVVNLPPGFLGNNTAMPTCTDAELIGGLGNTNSVLEPECPPDTQVGQISFDFTFFSEVEHWTLPVYNMETDTGVTATLGFKALILTQILPIRCGPRIPASPLPVPASTTWAKSTMFQSTSGASPPLPATTPNVVKNRRIRGCYNGGEEVKIPVKPFLSNPTSCTGPLKTTMKSDSWEEEDTTEKKRPKLRTLKQKRESKDANATP